MVPSIFPFKTPLTTSGKARPNRKRKWLEDSQRASDPVCPDVGCEEIIDGQSSEVKPTDSQYAGIEHDNIKHNVATPNGARCGIEHYKDNPKAVQYYTGFDNYDHFMLFLFILGPAAFNLLYKPEGITVQDQLFLTLMKLRQAKDDSELELMFNLKETVVSKIINTWINFLFFQLKEIDLWPSKQVVRDTMPKGFKEQFMSTRVILDATEVPIQKPGRVDDQSATFSSYKNRNTLKTIIGCSPRGLVSYISSSYGGSTSDRQIIERSEMVNDKTKFESGDSIMADRGLLVQDLFANKNVKVNTPSMLHGKSQLEPEVVVRDRRIASKRIHVERVIGLGKTYKLIKHQMSCYKAQLGHRIIFICYVLSNFRRSIVHRLA